MVPKIYLITSIKIFKISYTSGTAPRDVSVKGALYIRKPEVPAGFRSHFTVVIQPIRHSCALDKILFTAYITG